MSENNWKSRVYKEKEVEYQLKVLPRGKVLKRDHYTCQSCRQRLPAYALSTHHIIPRSENGTNILDNLITLCHYCHDLIEIAEPPIRTRQEILYHAVSLNELEKQLTESLESMPEEFDISRPIWHKWVYGGVKKQL